MQTTGAHTRIIPAAKWEVKTGTFPTKARCRRDFTGAGVGSKRQRDQTKVTRLFPAYFNLFDGNFDKINKIRDTFEFLALDGSPDGQFGLGFLYSTGIGGIKKNTAKAITYYNFAAIGGCPMATMAMVCFVIFLEKLQYPRSSFNRGGVEVATLLKNRI